MLLNLPDPNTIKNSNWDRVRTCLKIAQEEISKGNWDHRKICDSKMNSDVYSLECNGGIVINRVGGTEWIFWNGEWFENLLPWVLPIREKFAKAGLPIENITYHAHSGSISPHKDIAYLGEFWDKPHTNINFIISSEDPENSYTWVRDEFGNEMRYYSYPNKLWLLNASNLHAVVTTKFREGLIIKLRYSFDDVNNFLKLNPNIFNEN
jgi:hypothetical protein